jgi:hypothetical protein
VRGVDVKDGSHVADDASHRGRGRCVRPVVGVDLPDRIDRHRRDSEVSSEVNQAVDVPSVEAVTVVTATSGVENIDDHGTGPKCDGGRVMR